MWWRLASGRKFPPQSLQQEGKEDGKEANGFTWVWELLALLFVLNADEWLSPHCSASLLEFCPFKQLNSQHAITGWNHCLLKCRRSHQEHGRPRLRFLVHCVLIGTKQNNSLEGKDTPPEESQGMRGTFGRSRAESLAWTRAGVFDELPCHSSVG